jgi:hypothetical protein
MANTMTLIASSTVGSGGSVSISFTSIPSTYTDLVIKCSLRGNQASAVYTDVDVILTGATYSSGKILYTINGTSAASYGPGSNGFFAEASSASATSNTFSNCDIYIPNYTSSNNKSLSADSVIENNAASTVMTLNAGLYTSSAAITGVTLTYGTGSQGSFIQYSTAYLYGVKNA